MKDNKEDRVPDPIGEYLGRRLATTDEPDPGKVEPAWRASATKIAAWCLAAVLVPAVAILATMGGDEGGGRAQRSAGRPQPPPGRLVVGSIVMVRGEVTLLHGREAGAPRIGDDVHESDVIETGEDASIGLDLTSGPSLVLMARARASVVRRTDGEVTVALERGVIAADTSRPGARGGLRIEGLNADVVARGAVFTVAASGGVLEMMGVAAGEVAVLSRTGRKDVRIAKSSQLDMRTWTASAGEIHADALERLAQITSPPAPVEPLDAPDAQVATDAPALQDAAAPSLAQAMEGALDKGDADLAIELVEKEGKGHLDPELLLLSGDAYRQAGRWSEAVDAYLAAAHATSGKKAEKALLKAAEIRSRKLDDAAGAAGIIDEYLARFPAGIYLDEALYLGGTVQAKLGEFEKARDLFETYLETFPKGTQAVRVHLTLAKILATRLSDCPRAMVHVEAIQGMVTGPAVSKEAEKVAMICGAGKDKSE